MVEYRKIQGLISYLVAFVVFTWFIKAYATFTIPIGVGVILGFVFSPLLVFLRNKRIPASIALAVVIILYLVLSLLFLSLMINSIYSIIANDFNKYQQQFTAIIAAIEHAVPFIDASVLQEMQGNIFVFLQNNIFNFSRSFLQSFISLASKYFIISLTMVFVLLERRFVSRKIKKIYQTRGTHSSVVTQLFSKINAQVSRFLLLKTLISMVTAIIIYIGFSVIGVDLKFLWALLTFVFNFIPTIGSIIISVLSILFAIIQFFPNMTPVLLVVLLVGSTQMIVGNILDPKIMGDQLNVSPLVIWISLLYWGLVWGPIGTLLAVPLAVIIRILCEAIPSFHTVGILMGNGAAIKKDE